MKSHKQFSPLRMNLTLHFTVQTREWNGLYNINDHLVWSIIWCNVNRVTQSSGMCCSSCLWASLPSWCFCTGNCKSIVICVIHLCEAQTEVYETPRSCSFTADIQTVFSVGIKGICLAWRLNHAPCYTIISQQEFMMHRGHLCSLWFYVSHGRCAVPVRTVYPGDLL